MSAPEKVDMRGRLLTIQFWGGIVLAPLAALLLIAGAPTAAAVLAIIAVVILALAVIMRRDEAGKQLDIEETLLDEIDMLRDDVRADITTAARATHRALAEKVASLQETISIMQRQAEAARSGGERTSPPPQVPPPRRPAVAAGVVRRTEMVQVTTRQTIVDPMDDERGGYPRSPGRPEDRDDYRRDDRMGDRRAADGRLHGDRVGDLGSGWDDRDELGRGVRTDRRGNVRPPDPSADSGEMAVPGRARFGGEADPPDDGRWSAMRAGDRWAEIRSDDRGRELRMAERRAERRVDQIGTEVRIVDRWSSVRQELPRAADDVGAGRRAGHDGYPRRREDQTAENTGETRSERRRREEALELAAAERRPMRRPSVDGVERSHGQPASRAAPDADEAWRAPPPPAPAAVPVPRPALPASREPRDDVPDGWVANRRQLEIGARSVVDLGPRPDEVRSSGMDARLPVRVDDRDDDRWEREPGSRAGARPRRLDFEVTDDRWR